MIELTGLKTGSPIDFLAAIGMMRVLSEDRGLNVRLGWSNGQALIDGITPDDLLQEIAENMDGRDKAPEFCWADTPRKVAPDVYRHSCLKMQNDHRALGFMAGWATDSILRDGFVATTRMDMTSGQQKILRDLRAIAGSVTIEHFRIALFGGPYEDQSSFGLDPIAVRSHAHESQAPTKTKAPGKPGLIWLAFESIPLHPVIPIAANRSQTVGWSRHPSLGYAWPIWDALLSLEEIRFLRTLPVDSLYNRPGVREVWLSKYGSSGKYGMLYPARRER